MLIKKRSCKKSNNSSLPYLPNLEPITDEASRAGSNPSLGHLVGAEEDIDLLFGNLQPTGDDADLSNLVGKPTKDHYHQYLEKITLPGASNIKKGLMDNFTEEDNQYSCTLCKKKYPLNTLETSLESHLRRNHRQNWRCLLCGDVYKERSVAVAHLRKKHSDKISQAQGQLEQVFFAEQALEAVPGYAITSSATASIGDDADLGNIVDRLTNDHYHQYLEKITPPDASNIKKELMDNFTKEGNQHSCTLCGKKYPLDTLETSLKRHLRMEDQQKWKCLICSKETGKETITKERHEAVIHLKAKHPEILRGLEASQAQIPTEQVVSDEQALQSASGGAITSSTTDLNSGFFDYRDIVEEVNQETAHLVKKNIEDNFTKVEDGHQCNICKSIIRDSKTLSTKMSRHVKSHLVIWRCLGCNKTFKREDNAKTHALRETRDCRKNMYYGNNLETSLPQPNNLPNIPFPAPMLLYQGDSFQDDGFTVKDLALLAQIEQEQNSTTQAFPAAQAVSAAQALETVSGGAVNSTTLP